MATKPVEPPLIVITGPTASGKTGLAVRLAAQWDGEIVCADSRTVYRGMDIGTAKPTPEEQALVPHWLLDIASPGERFTVADFKRLATEAIADIRSRDKIPFLVGGTGLYVDAVVLGYSFGPDSDSERRAELEQLSIDELKTMIKQQRLKLPENSENKRYLVRCIEKNNTSITGKNWPDDTTHVVAISTDREILRGRIAERAKDMFNENILQETQRLLNAYGLQGEAMTGNIYPLVAQVIRGELTEEEARERFIAKDWQLARRQLTWLRRHDYVTWLELKEAEGYISAIIKQYRDGRTL